MKNRIDAC